MNVALFIHPADTYIHRVFGSTRKADYYRALGTVIETRFRSSKWGVYWLLHADPSHRDKPDFSCISDNLPIDFANDTFLISRVTLEESENGTQRQDFTPILDRCRNIERIAVCGFHDRMDVDAFANAAQTYGMQPIVHDDLTDAGLNELTLDALTTKPGEITIPFLKLALTAPLDRGPEFRTQYITEHDYRAKRAWRAIVPWYSNFIRIHTDVAVA